MALTKRSLITLAPFALFFAFIAATNAHPLPHAQLAKRQLIGVDLGIINAPQDPNPAGTNDATLSIAADPTDTATQTSPTGRGPLISLSIPPLLGGGNSNTRSTTPSSTTTTSSIPTSSSTPITPTPGNPLATPVAPPPQTETVNTVVLFTQTNPLPSTPTENTIENQQGAAKKDDNKSRNMIIIIVASVAGGLGLIAIVWTIFRKMKLKPSDEFEERLHPIDWQPTVGMTEHHRSASLRSNRTGGGVASDAQSTKTYGAASQRGLISDLPNHDFTAGAAAPVGTYASLSRSASGRTQHGAAYGGY